LNGCFNKTFYLFTASIKARDAKCVNADHRSSCDIYNDFRYSLFEQTDESGERFTVTTLLKLTNPPLNRYGLSILVAGRFGFGRSLRNLSFHVLDDFDYGLCVHLLTHI
jgi:hypothetical protein